MKQIEFGIDTFGDQMSDLEVGTLISHAQTIRNVVELGKKADEVGVDYFAIGEHHRDDYAVSAPDTVLAGLATVTDNIKLSTAVTVLSSDDPVRLYERFATVDALSNGRATIMLGRGSFTESFPLFGYSLSDYEELFEEKLELFTKLQTQQPLTWKGKHTQDLNNVKLYPPIEDGRTLPAWVAVGGSPQSVIRAAKYDLPLMLAVIGGHAARFAPFAKLYRDAREKFGHEGPSQVGYNLNGHIAETDEEAFEQFVPHHQKAFSRIGAERGWGESLSMASIRREVNYGALAVGSPETVARKIFEGIKALGPTRVDFKITNGPLPQEHSLRAVELYGTEVVPRVRELLAEAG